MKFVRTYLFITYTFNSIFFIMLEIIQMIEAKGQRRNIQQIYEAKR